MPVTKMCAILLLLASCSTYRELPTQAEKDRAVETVWQAVRVQFPYVREKPDITVTLSQHYLRAQNDPRLYEGLAYECRLYVRWNGAFSLSSLSHEIIHCLQYLGGYPDHQHLRRGDWSMVEVANDALYYHGM